MKHIFSRAAPLLLFIVALPLHAAGTVTSTLAKLANSDTYVVTVTATADSSDGSFPTHYLPRSGSGVSETDGFSILAVVTDPGSTAPTDNWDLTITDAAGLDLMAGECADRDTSTTEKCSADPVPLNGATALNITNNSVNSATITIRIYLARLTVAKRGGSAVGGGGGSGTVSGTAGAIAAFTDATTVGDATAGPGVVIAAGEIASDDAVIPTKATAAGTPTMAGQLTGSIAVDTSASPDRLYFCGADDGTDCTAVIRLFGYAELLPLSSGGTNQTSWTASRCVQVNAGGTALESAAAACGSGGSSLGFAFSGNFGGNTVSSGVTTFGAHFIQSFSTTENQRQWKVPAACTLRNLHLRTQGNEPAGQTLVATVRVNGVDTSITITVTDSTDNNDLSDLVNTAAAAQGDRISVKFVEGTGTSTGLYEFSLQCN